MFNIELNIRARQLSIQERYRTDIEYPNLMAQLCKKIEKYNLAEFKLVFPKSDIYFKYIDISYDFLSILDSIIPFTRYLQSKTGTFSLFLYEIRINLCFTYNSDVLYLSILKDNEIVNHLQIDSVLLLNMMESIIKNFHYIVKHYFPKAYDLLTTKFNFFNNM